MTEQSEKYVPHNMKNLIAPQFFTIFFSQLKLKTFFKKAFGSEEKTFVNFGPILTFNIEILKKN